MSVTDPAPRGRHRIRRPRITFATRLLLGGFTLSLGIITAVSAFLLVSRDQQTQVGAQTNAQSRAQAYRELLQQVAAPQARFAAQDVAGLPSMAAALQTTPASPEAVAALLSGPTKVITDLPDETVSVFNIDGTLLATTEAAGAPQVSSGLESVRAALLGSPAEAIDFVAPQTPFYDFAAPVIAQGTTQVLGAVVYSMPLESQMLRLVGAVGQGYVPVLIPNQAGASLIRLSGSAASPHASTQPLPASLRAHLGGSADSFEGFYTVAGSAQAAAFEGMNPNPGTPVVYIGVETPLSAFTGDQATDELTVVVLALTALLVTWLLVLLFVNRFVRRPVAYLSAGVGRIAGGDYGTDIPVTSHDELGVLAHQVNRMRAQIESNVRHVDAAVSRLNEVSRALTTTTAGVSSLESAVCAAASTMSGPDARACILHRQEDTLVLRAGADDGSPCPELPADVVADVLAGQTARFTAQDHGPSRACLAVPMFYQQRVSGAIVVAGPGAVSDADTRALSALANNAAIALENTRLFEQERETVQRLRQLDAMKSDFLATAQHELRTPVTAIIGHLELMRMLWPETDDTQKLAIVDDIELSTRQLADMLETIIDLSLVSAATLRLQRREVGLAGEVQATVDDLSRRFPHGLPVELTVDIAPELTVDADPERLRQIIRCLLDNAVKFTEPGGSVGISAHLAEDGEHCRIEISDTGIGIHPALQEKVFERFFQVDSGGTRAYGGMGVGLALVKVLAEAHGVDVVLDSGLGEGTRVRLDWPCHLRADASLPGERPAGHAEVLAGEDHVTLTASKQSYSAT
jgi:signal transduction histidine kinase